MVSLVQISINIENFIVENPKAAAILLGAFLLIIGSLIPNIWLSAAGFGTLLFSVLASLPKDA